MFSSIVFPGSQQWVKSDIKIDWGHSTLAKLLLQQQGFCLLVIQFYLNVWDPESTELNPSNYMKINHLSFRKYITFQVIPQHHLHSIHMEIFQAILSGPAKSQKSGNRIRRLPVRGALTGF